jgi:hypothetical protein
MCVNRREELQAKRRELAPRIQALEQLTTIGDPAERQRLLAEARAEMDAIDKELASLK